MPVYEYRCDHCSHQFEATQSMHARPEDTVCPQCTGMGATRMLSSFASQVKGSHKTGYEEQKAYSMLNERMHRFSKLPPAMGKRVPVTPEMMSEPMRLPPPETTNRDHRRHGSRTVSPFTHPSTQGPEPTRRRSDRESRRAWIVESACMSVCCCYAW